MGNALYHETHRPQFHFTPLRNWTNDPNGLVYYQGEYHLFFQHNPTGIKWGNMTWGHAVSPDLVHWTQLPNAIEPDALGTIFSGSAVVDWHNTAGLQTGSEPPLVAIYTSAGSEVKPPAPFTQSIAYSNDRGRTWNKYAQQPGARPHRGRQPRPQGHLARAQPTVGHGALPGRQRLCPVRLARPEGLDTAVRRGHARRRRVPRLLRAAGGRRPRAAPAGSFGARMGCYRLGTFDGATFTPETDVLARRWGANGYAAQTWSDIPPADGRRIQISWMAGGKYPAMPFNQQFSFPVELTLRSTPQGLRLFRQPVRELALLHAKEHRWENVTLTPGANLIPQTACELFDVHLEVALGRCHGLRSCWCADTTCATTWPRPS